MSNFPQGYIWAKNLQFRKIFHKRDKWTWWVISILFIFIVSYKYLRCVHGILFPFPLLLYVQCTVYSMYCTSPQGNHCSWTLKFKPLWTSLDQITSRNLAKYQIQMDFLKGVCSEILFGPQSFIQAPCEQAKMILKRYSQNSHIWLVVVVIIADFVDL